MFYLPAFRKIILPVCSAQHCHNSDQNTYSIGCINTRALRDICESFCLSVTSHTHTHTNTHAKNTHNHSYVYNLLYVYIYIYIYICIYMYVYTRAYLCVCVCACVGDFKVLQ
jgi:hypothetical protein